MAFATLRVADERDSLLPKSDLTRKMKTTSRFKLLATLALALLCGILIVALITPVGEQSGSLAVADSQMNDDTDFKTSQTPSDFLNGHWNDLTKEAQQAVEDLEDAIDKLKLPPTMEVPKDIINAVHSINVTAFVNWLEQASEDGLKDALERLSAVNLKELPKETLHWIEEHPEETAFYIIETVAFFVPGGVWGPLLRSLGFTARGVRARSIAALIHSRIAPLLPKKKGWFATLLSAAMGGLFGKKHLDRGTRIGIKIGGFFGWLFGHH